MENGHTRHCGLVRGLHVNNITIGGTSNGLNYFGIFIAYTHFTWGTRWCSWLRHYATSRKVAGLIPDDVIQNFSLT